MGHQRSEKKQPLKEKKGTDKSLKTAKKDKVSKLDRLVHKEEKKALKVRRPKALLDPMTVSDKQLTSMDDDNLFKIDSVPTEAEFEAEDTTPVRKYFKPLTRYFVDPVCPRCKKPDHEIQDCKVLPRGMKCCICDSNEHFVRNCPKSRRNMKKNKNLLICYKCGVEGHRGSECTTKPKRMFQKKAREEQINPNCPKCKGFGHDVEDCPRNRDKFNRDQRDSVKGGRGKGKGKDATKKGKGKDTSKKRKGKESPRKGRKEADAKLGGKGRVHSDQPRQRKAKRGFGDLKPRKRT